MQARLKQKTAAWLVPPLAEGTGYGFWHRKINLSTTVEERILKHNEALFTN